MANVKTRVWEVINDTAFEIVIINVTPSSAKPAIADYNIENVTFLCTGVIKPGEKRAIPVSKINTEVIAARAIDGFPLMKTVPQLNEKGVYIPTVVNKKDYLQSQQAVSLIKDYYAAIISDLTTDLNTLIKKTYNEANYVEVRKDVTEFLNQNYKDFNAGPNQYLDNLYMVESYLSNFPDSWLRPDITLAHPAIEKLYLYYAGDLKSSDDDGTSLLSCMGTISITHPKNKIVDLQKGSNNGYKLKLTVTGAGEVLLKYRNGAFTFVTEDATKVTMKPVLMRRGTVYSGVNIKHKSSKNNADEIITVCIGKVLGHIVLAIPDEIDLNMYNAKTKVLGHSTPIWKESDTWMTLIGGVLMCASILACYLYRRKTIKMKSLGTPSEVIDLIDDDDVDVLWTSGASNSQDSNRISLLKNNVNKVVNIEELSVLAINNDIRTLRNDEDYIKTLTLVDENTARTMKSLKDVTHSVTSSITDGAGASSLDTSINSAVAEKTVDIKQFYLTNFRRVSMNFMTLKINHAIIYSNIIQALTIIHVDTSTLSAARNEMHNINFKLKKLLGQKESGPLDEYINNINELKDKVVAAYKGFDSAFSKLREQIVIQDDNQSQIETLDTNSGKLDELRGQIDNCVDELNSELKKAKENEEILA